MLVLLVETPSASELGQRFIVSKRGPESEKDLIARVQDQDRGEGPDFIAARWPVKQRLPNQTVRDDHEGIMLLGVDTSQMSEGHRARVHEALAHLESSVRDLVTGFDWSLHEHSLVVESEQLAEWLTRPEFSGLPACPEPPPAPRPEPPLEPSPQQRPLPKLVVALSFISLAMCALYFNRKSTPAPEPDIFASRIEEVVASLKCSQKDLELWVAAARGLKEDSRTPAIDEATLRRLEDGAPTSRFFPAADVSKETSQLPEFISLLAPVTAEDGMRIRQSLKGAHHGLLELASAAREARTQCPDWKAAVKKKTASFRAMEDDAVEFIQALMSLDAELTRKCDDGDEEIRQPFFSVEDACRFDDLATFFSPERKNAVEARTPVRFESHRIAEALWEAARSSGMTEDERYRVQDAGNDAYLRTNCQAFQRLTTAFTEMCKALGELPPAPAHEVAGE